MSECAPFDWRSSPPSGNFRWLKEGLFFDCDGRRGEVGSICQLLRPAIGFDEKGGRKGLFVAGQQLPVEAISTSDQVLLYFGGFGGTEYWLMTAVQPADVKIITETSC